MDEVTEELQPEPVFVDTTGRRRTMARNTGIVVGCLLAGYLVIIAFGLVTDTRVPLTPWPAPDVTHGAPRHDGLLPKGALPTPKPTDSARPGTTAPSGPAPTARPTSKTSTAPAASPTTPARPSATHTNKGKSYGRTKSPNPRKP